MAEQMGGDDYYVELPEERYSCGYLCDFDNFKKTRNSRVSLAAAYNAENFLLGISRINSGINNGSLVIPNDSIIHTQLQDITRPDLEEKPEKRFHGHQWCSPRHLQLSQACPVFAENILVGTET